MKCLDIFTEANLWENRHIANLEFDRQSTKKICVKSDAKRLTKIVEASLNTDKNTMISHLDSLFHDYKVEPNLPDEETAIKTKTRYIQRYNPPKANCAPKSKSIYVAVTRLINRTLNYIMLPKVIPYMSVKYRCPKAFYDLVSERRDPILRDGVLVDDTWLFAGIFCCKIG